MDLEDVTKVILRRLLILGNVGKVGEIVGVLAGPVDVADLVLADGLLSSGRERRTEGGKSNRRNEKPSCLLLETGNGARGISPVDACAVGKPAPAQLIYQVPPTFLTKTQPDESARLYI